MSSFFRQVSDSDSDTDSELEEELTDSTLSDSEASQSGSDESSDEDSSGGDEDEQETQEAPKAPRASRFLRDADSDSDSEDENRAKVVKSAKSKREEEEENHIRTIENASNINDWVLIQNEFDKFTRLVQRNADLGKSAVPAGYLKIFGDIHAALNADEKPKMNATNARAMNGMKQRIRKLSKEWQPLLDEYNADPEAYKTKISTDKKPAPQQTSAGLSTTVAASEVDDGFQQVGAKGKVKQISTESVFKTLAAVNEARGRKGTDRSEQIDILTKLVGVAKTTYQQIRVHLAIIAALLDYSPATVAYMNIDHWNQALKHSDILVSLLVENPAYKVSESAPDYDEQIERFPTETEPIVHVRGSLASMLERLDDEFTKSLQNIDPHTDEYVTRLSEERPLYGSIVAMIKYLDSHNESSASESAPVFGSTTVAPVSGAVSGVDRLVMRRLDHIYAKPDTIIHLFEGQPVASSHPGQDENLVVKDLAARLYKASAAVLRTRALLCEIYHLAARGLFYTARDMLLMSHLQDSILSADVTAQIAHNRVVVQLGLAAFKAGLIRDAQLILHDIFATQRVRELLAQGIPSARFSTQPTDQDKVDRSRQLPYHMHINLELLECVYLVSSMLVEVPLMALAGTDPDARKRASLSRTFRRLLDFNDRQTFVGPPENKRDHIIQAAKALQLGHWRRATQLVSAIKIWHLFDDEVTIKATLASNIKTEALRTYLFTHAPLYNSLSIPFLADSFDLSADATRAIIASAIFNDELKAAIDETSDTLVVTPAHVSSLQSLSLALADKASQLTEQSERQIDRADRFQDRSRFRAFKPPRFKA